MRVGCGMWDVCGIHNCTVGIIDIIACTVHCRLLLVYILWHVLKMHVRYV